MSAQIIDGKALALEIKKNVRKQIVEQGLTPGLAVFLVGDDAPSKLYVKLKQKACKDVGIDFHLYECEADQSQESIEAAVDFINQDPSIDAILIQVPLPKHFDQDKIIQKMLPSKDVDGFHPKTMELFLNNQSDFMPGLTNGILHLIQSTDQELKNKQAVIISNSPIFAKPLQKVLEQKNVETISTNPQDVDLKDKTTQADIIIIAIGQANFLTADMIKEGAILIDVGTNKKGKKVIGDIDYKSVKEKAGFITPVPGGVGPVTVSMLLENTVKLCLKNKKTTK